LRSGVLLRADLLRVYLLHQRGLRGHQGRRSAIGGVYWLARSQGLLRASRLLCIDRGRLGPGWSRLGNCPLIANDVLDRYLLQDRRRAADRGR